MLKVCCFVPGESIRFVPPNSTDSREGTEIRKGLSNAAARRRLFSQQGRPGGGSTPLYAMPQALHPAHQLFLKAQCALPRIRIPGGSALALQFGQGELRELEGVLEIFGAAFVMDSQLFAGLDAIRWVARQFVPQGCRAVTIPPAFGHQRKLPRRARTELHRQARVQGLQTS